MDSGPTQRRHVFVEAIEDIGKEADRWDDEEPLTADAEFTVSYGVSAVDRQTMLAVIQSISKRSLARAAKVSTRSIPSDEAAASQLAGACPGFALSAEDAPDFLATAPVARTAIERGKIAGGRVDAERGRSAPTRPSSAEEHSLHTGGVAGSIPAASVSP